MYSKFDLKIPDSFYNIELDRHLESGKKIYNDFEESSKECLKSFIYDNGHIDGSSLKKHWFSSQKADIFISHSHKDINKVKAFAGWLYDEFNLKSFIDSCVWGYCNDLLRQIDEVHCKNEYGDTYDYQLRNYTTSHVHMMLSIALSEMIDNTECVIFYNTPNSVTMKNDLDIINNSTENVTLSPWIYHELAMTTLIRKSYLGRPEVFLEKSFDNRTDYEHNAINIEHGVEQYLGNMVSLAVEDLKNWNKTFKILRHEIDGDDIPYVSGYEKMHPLDILYMIKKPI